VTGPGIEPGSLAEVFRRTARYRGAAPAVAQGRREWSYAHLDTASDALARRIAAAGVRRGDIVGVVGDRSVTAVAAILGVLKAGAAYLPLDPAYPGERLRYLLADTGAKVIVGAAGPASAIADGRVPVIDPGDAAGEPVSPAVGQAGPGDPAYVIYTSGSTGRPKGCVVTHGNVLALLRGALPLFDVGPADRWALFHSFSFDFSVWELWGAFATGGVAVSVPASAARSPEEFVRLLADARVTVLNQVPSVFGYTALAYADAGRPGLALRYLIFGGESVKLEVARAFLDDVAGCGPTAVNMYGITETTVHVTCKPLADADLRGEVRSPIGVPLPHLSVTLRDVHGEPVPDGSVGEMWVAGPGVCAGYLNQPELTAERFVTRDGTRYYRSGDLARRLPDGELEYVGRGDDQVKLRGFRIELGEVESALRRSTLVQDAAALVAELPSGAQLLTACVVPASSARPGLVRELRQHAAGLLPAHMAPDRYHVLDELPLTPSGKVDRAAAARLVSISVPEQQRRRN
jgi:amino acid adenylation domain-containing protein